MIKTPGFARVKKPSNSHVPKQGTQTENIKNFLERNQASSDDNLLLRQEGENPPGICDSRSRKLLQAATVPGDSISTCINIKPLKMSSYLVLNDPKCNSDIHCTVPLDKELLFETCSVGKT